MKSKLTITEFRERLKENTKIGIPQARLNFGILSFFFNSSEYFYGNFDDSIFRLSRNANYYTNFYFLKGKYRNINNELNLNYAILPLSKFGMIWIKYFPFVTLIGGNCILYFTDKNAPNEVFVIFNLFLVFAFFYLRWNLKRDKKNLEMKFNKIFEVIE